MKRRLTLLALEFVALTVPATWLWLEWGRDAYYRFFLALSRPILIELGVTGVRRSLVQDRFINYLPFIVLMIITPAMSWRRRVVGTLVGCVVLFVGHIGLTYVSFITFIRDGTTRESMSDFFPALMFSDALPFILWAVIANEFLLGFIERWSGRKALAESDGESDTGGVRGE